MLALLAAIAACTAGGPPSVRRTAVATATPVPSAAASPTAAPTPTATPAPTASADADQDIHSGIATDDAPGSAATLPPVGTPTATPTPLGARGQVFVVPGNPMWIAFLQGATRPSVLRQASLAEITSGNQVGQTHTSGIGMPRGLAADGPKDLWVLSASPPHVDRVQLDLGSFGIVASYAVAASPSAIAVRAGEAWVASAGGALTRIVASTGATTSFTIAGVSGEPAAVALDASFVWVAGPAGAVYKIDRSTGEQAAKYVTGADPVGLALDSGGAVWTADRGASASTRITASGSTTSIALGAAPAAVVADSRRIWFGLPGKLSYYEPGGTFGGEATLSVVDPLEFQPRPLEPAHLAIDAEGRIWALDRGTGELAPVWGKGPGE